MITLKSDGPLARLRRYALAACLIVGLVPASTGASSQPPSELATQPTGAAETTQPSDIAEITAADLTEENIRARLVKAEAATDVPESVRTELIGLYQQTLDQIRLAASWAAKAEEFRRGREEAPQLLEAVRQSLAQATSAAATQPVLEIPPDTTLEQLTQRLGEVEADLKAKQDLVQSLGAEAANRAKRTAAIPDLLADANKRLERAKQQPPPPPSDALPQIVSARGALLLAQRRAVEQEIRAYDEELRFYDARSALLAARRDRAALDLAEAQARHAAWQEAVNQRRQAEVEQQKRLAEEELRRTPQVIRNLADYNLARARERDELVALNQAAAERTRSARGHSERLSKEFSSLQQAIGQKLLAESIGPLMRKMRSELAGLRGHERDLRLDRLEFARVQSRLAEIDEERASLANLDARATAELQRLAELDPQINLERLRPRVQELLDKRRALLDDLLPEYRAYATSLIELITAQSILLAKIEEFGRLIDQHVLWVRSSAPLYTARLPVSWSGVAQGWLALGRAAWSDIRTHTSTYALASLILVALLALQPKLRTDLRRIRDRVAKHYTDKYVLTLFALAYTALLAAPWPFLLWFLGWRLSLTTTAGQMESYELAQALGLGFRAAALGLLTLELLRQICRPDGLAHRHFRWDSSALRLLRRHLTWLALLIVPATCVVAVTERHPEDVWRDGLGRLALLAGMIGLSIFALRLMRPASGILAGWLRKNPTSWASQFRYAWYLASVLAPLVLAAASAAGYHYTAVQLSLRLLYTLWLALGLLLLQALLLRGLLVGQRRLAIEQAHKKRAAAAETHPADPTAAAEAPPVDEQTLSLVTIGAQTRKLLRSLVAFGLLIGLWLTWADMLPALSFVHKVQLWSYEVKEAVAGGETGGPAAVRIEHITLGHVIVATLIGLATYVMARNIPGLLEITVLQRLPLDAGGRFAVTAIARYTITVVGLIAAFGALGIGWSKVQWLVAAVSVGLGFGLQEIFANFVSGLILLFERPIRIGDTVTVGNISGTVTRIRIRATTVTDWDRKELVIPNKQFITGQVINWTLSDPMLRMTIPVGLAYGSDTDLAEQLLAKVAREEPLVLADPPPRVLFMGFGDSALDYELRVFIASVEHLLQARHQLHKAIDREFRKAGLEIAFPQRDIHIRTVTPVVRLEQRRRKRGREDQPIPQPDQADDPRR